MVKIKIKRVYEDPDPSDGFRVFIDKLWPRGVSKEEFHYDDWEKDIAPSKELREWFHADESGRWEQFQSLYKKELSHSEPVKSFIDNIRNKDTVTLLYASKEPIRNHARILQKFLEEKFLK